MRLSATAFEWFSFFVLLIREYTHSLESPTPAMDGTCAAIEPDRIQTRYHGDRPPARDNRRPGDNQTDLNAFDPTAGLYDAVNPGREACVQITPRKLGDYWTRV
jgi:hypothetical protein